jgi:nicotinamide riboside kinase
MQSRPLLISVLGGECTGKTALCRSLAERYQGLTFTEILRAWVEQAGRSPRQHEQRQIFQAQCDQEARQIEQASRAGLRAVFVDSGPVMTAVYSQVYFSDDSLLQESLRWQLRYDLTLICADDLPWVPDPGQRDGVDYRARAQATLQDALGKGFSGAVARIDGLDAQRVMFASRYVERLLSSPR